MRIAYDSYAAHLVSDAYREQDLHVLEENFPGKKFHTLESIRDLAQEYSIQAMGVTSLGPWADPEEKSYKTLLGEGDFEDRPDDFFRASNMTLMEQSPEEIEAQDQEGIHWWAMIGGHFPEKLVPSLASHEGMFGGIKVGASRTIELASERFDPLWDYASEKEIPLMLHCSSEHGEDFSQGVSVAQRYPKIPAVVLSHLGGDLPSEDLPSSIRERNLVLSQRGNMLEEPDINNLYFNTAVQNLADVWMVVKGQQSRLSQVLFASDQPLLQWNWETLNIPPWGFDQMQKSTRDFLELMGETQVRLRGALV